MSKKSKSDGAILGTQQEVDLDLCGVCEGDGVLESGFGDKSILVKCECKELDFSGGSLGSDDR